MLNYMNNQDVINLRRECEKLVTDYNAAFIAPDADEQKKCDALLSDLAIAEKKYNDKVEALVYAELSVEEYPFFEAAKALTFNGLSHTDDIQQVKLPGSSPVSVKVGIKLVDKEIFVDMAELSAQVKIGVARWYFEMIGVYQHVAINLAKDLDVDEGSVGEKLKPLTDTLKRLQENERKGINNGSVNQLKKTIEHMAKEILTYRQRVDIDENGNFKFVKLEPRTKDELKAVKKNKDAQPVYPELLTAMPCDVAFVENAVTSKGKGKTIKLMSVPKFFEVLYTVMNRIATNGKYDLDVKPGVSPSIRNLLTKTNYGDITPVDPFAGDVAE